MYMSNKDFLYSNIILYQNKIVNAAKSKLKNLKDKDVKQAMNSYIDSISGKYYQYNKTKSQKDFSVIVQSHPSYLHYKTAFYYRRETRIGNKCCFVAATLLGSIDSIKKKRKDFLETIP